MDWVYGVIVIDWSWSFYLFDVLVFIVEFEDDVDGEKVLVIDRGVKWFVDRVVEFRVIVGLGVDWENEELLVEV